MTRFRPGDVYPGRGSKGGRARHYGHPIRVIRVEQLDEGHDRVHVWCDCGERWSFVHWWRRLA